MTVTPAIVLPLGKAVEPVWDKKNTVESIIIKPNMALSLFENNVVDHRSIYQVEKIVLITMYKKMTEVPIKKVSLAADGSYWFHATEEERIKRAQLVVPRNRMGR